MWLKYPSIENSYRQEFINKCKQKLLEPENLDITFYVTEKIHGCNISFYFNKDEQIIDVYSRNNKLQDLSKLGIDKVLQDKNIINILFEIIEQNYNTANEICFYGEYFGGVYNGSSNGKKIQNIEYCSENNIMFFDIQIDGKFENFDKVVSIFSSTPNLLVPILKYNLNFNEALKYRNNYETLVPDFFKHQKKKEKENICEGNVIRPSKELNIGAHRFILKNKNETHSDNKLSIKNSKKYDTKIIENYLTNARVESARSKLMPQYSDNIPINILLKEIVNDIINDYQKDVGVENIDKDEIKYYKKFLGSAIFNFIKTTI